MLYIQYIQITTFFGSRCKLKMSCFRPNYCAARKVRFQQFFPPKHPFYLGGGYVLPRCVPVPRVPAAPEGQRPHCAVLPRGRDAPELPGSPG